MAMGSSLMIFQKCMKRTPILILQIWHRSCSLLKIINFRIANALAITSDDLDALYEAGVGFYWDENHRIKDDVRTAYEEVKKQISLERTRASWKHPKYSDDRHYMYTPETFRGLT